MTAHGVLQQLLLMMMLWHLLRLNTLRRLLQRVGRKLLIRDECLGRVSGRSRLPLIQKVVQGEELLCLIA